jgi:cation diffusion facilitator family transporter
MTPDRRKKQAALLSVFSNTFLVGLKISVGILIGSVSVLSEAVHSAVDLLAALIAWLAVRASGKPADSTHPFGHGKMENLSGAIEALLIFLAAGWIMYEALLKLWDPKPIEDWGLGLGVMLLSVILNLFVSRMLFRVAQETDSVALQADAWHLRTDVYTSAGVMGGLALIGVSEKIFPGRHFDWVDPVAAIGVAVLILRVAYRLTLQSARDLVDVHFPEMEQWIREEVSRQNLPIHGLHRLRTRKAGSIPFVDLHVVMDPHLSLEESHGITDRIVARIRQKFPNAEVVVHAEPCDGRCSRNCQSGCFLGEEEKRKVQQSLP